MHEASPQDRPGLPTEIEAELRDSLNSALRERLPEPDLATVIATVRAFLIRVEQNYHLTDGEGLHAEEAERLDRVSPGFGQRYGDAIIRSLDHQVDWERKDQQILQEHQQQGMKYGFFLGIALVIGAVICGIVGATEIGIALAGASAVGMVGKFVDGWRRKND